MIMCVYIYTLSLYIYIYTYTVDFCRCIMHVYICIYIYINNPVELGPFPIFRQTHCVVSNIVGMMIPEIYGPAG